MCVWGGGSGLACVCVTEERARGVVSMCIHPRQRPSLMDIECTFRAINQTLRLEKTRLEARGRAAAPTEANAVTVFLAEEDSGRAGPASPDEYR